MKNLILIMISIGAVNTSFATTESSSTIKTTQTIASATVKQSASAVTANANKNADVLATIPCDDQTSACYVVKDTSQKVIQAINQNQDFTKIQSIVEPSFNFNLMTKFTLGNNWKLAKHPQQQELVNNFTDLLVYTYATALSKFKGAKMTIISQQKLTNRTTAIISQVILPNSGASNNQAVKIEYDLAKTPPEAIQTAIKQHNPIPNAWQAYDIKIENASLVTTYRNQFNDIIQSNKTNGINELIKQLQAKVESLKKAQ